MGYWIDVPIKNWQTTGGDVPIEGDQIPCDNGNCPVGYECRDGWCEEESGTGDPIVEKTACEQNCWDLLQDCNRDNPTNLGFCEQEYETCMNACEGGGGVGGVCQYDEDCLEGYRCVNGQCVAIDDPSIDPDEDSAEGCSGGYLLAESPISGGTGSLYLDDEFGSGGWMRHGDMEAHYYWHPDYGYHFIDTVIAHVENGVAPADNLGGTVCQKAYQRETINGQEWCCPAGGDDGGGGLGEYSYPPELQNFFKLLMGRGTDLLGMPLGLTQEEMDAMFGQGFENIRGQEGGMQNDLTSWLQSMGALGSGAELEQRGKVARGTQQSMSDLMRNLLIYGSERKKSDLLDYTGEARGIFGQGLWYEQLLEAINASRRGEGSDAIDQWLRYLGLLQY